MAALYLLILKVGEIADLAPSMMEAVCFALVPVGCMVSLWPRDIGPSKDLQYF